MNTSIPIFIICCNRLTVLQESINSFRKCIGTPFQLVIHDNRSSYEPLLAYLKQLESQGIMVYHASDDVDFSDHNQILNNISSTIEMYFKKHSAPYYVVTDPDIALVPPCNDILDLYAHILDTNRHVEVVGPMLRIDDIPDYYPLKDEAIRRHTAQFWHKTPSFLQWKGNKIGFQEALVDTTFGMYRAGYKFHRLSKGFRIYQPYWARHLDWYINPEKMPDDQIYYMEHASNVSHWGGVWLKNRGVDSLPPLNTQYYEGEDNYTDGDVEERISSYIHEYEPEQYSAIFEGDDEWAVFYHLTQIRKNLLNWYGFNPDSALLEIGAGMGGLTSLFCEKCAHVTAVEMSKRRASAIQARCRKHKNLEIMVGDFTRMQFGRKYDYITVIGVLEYQSVYGSGDTPQLDFLKKLKELLAPGGKIIVAIENKLGLKYWAGTAEDHTGIPFDSINDYAYLGAGKKARTFDRQELALLLCDSGLGSQKFYYPLPDYKLPKAIYTDGYMPQANLQMFPKTTHYPNAFERGLSVVVDEDKVKEPIIRNGVFPFFANSFLVECSADDASFDGTLFASTDGCRADKCRVTTRFDGERFYKSAASSKALPHVKRCFDIANELSERGIPLVPYRCERGELSTPAMRHETVEERFARFLRKGDLSSAKELLDRLYDFILRSSEVTDLADFDILPPEQRSLDFGAVLKKAYFDMIMSNCFYADGDFLFFDQEWVANNLPASFVLFRALNNAYSRNPHFEELCPIEHWKVQYSLVALWSSFEFLDGILVKDILCNDAHVMVKQEYVPVGTVQGNMALLQTSGQEIISILNSRSWRAMLLLKHVARKTGVLFLLRALLAIRRRLLIKLGKK